MEIKPRIPCIYCIIRERISHLLVYKKSKSRLIESSETYACSDANTYVDDCHLHDDDNHVYNWVMGWFDGLMVQPSAAKANAIA